MSLSTNNYALISLELLTVMKINLNGNTAGPFPIVSKISSSKSSENFPDGTYNSKYRQSKTTSSPNAQWYLSNNIVIFSQLKKVEVDAFVDG